MQIAIVTFGSRVSPRFDCAQSVLLVRAEESKVVGKEEIFSTDWAPHQRVAELAKRNVEVVICGAIDRWSAESLDAEGISILAWITGEVEDALACFLRGELVPEAIMGAGGRCCGRWRFGDGKGGLANELSNLSGTPENREQTPYMPAADPRPGAGAGRGARRGRRRGRGP